MIPFSSTNLCPVVLALLSSAVGLPRPPLSAADWPGWRGRDGNGVAEGNALPVEWSAEKNRLWKLELPEWGNSSPCVVGERIYLTSQTEDTSLHVLAIDRTKGALVWDKVAGKGTQKHHELHNMATPTCVADEERVWALFGTGDFVCLDRGGETVWKRNLAEEQGEYKILWGMGSSPRLHGERIYVACMHSGPSYVLAVDKKTGEDVWKTERKLPCEGEAVDSYSSPVVLEAGGLTALVVAGADHVNAYDLRRGRELWISSGLSIPHEYGRTIASPATGDGMVFAVSSGYGGLGRVLALDLREPAEGDITASRRLWTYEKYAPDCPTPLYYRGNVYLVRDNGVGSAIVAASGRVLWRERLAKGDVKASPVAGDGKVYFTAKDGECVVVAAGPELKVLARNSIDGPVIATPALSGGAVYIRSRSSLWAFGSR